MTDTITPRDAKEVEAVIQWAIAHEKTLEIVGRGTKRALGRPAQSDATLDLSALDGVTLYEPEELVLTARAGADRAEVETLLAASGQELAFEPMDYGPLLGAAEARGTIGGMIGAGLAGPRRLKAGALRDHLLGFTAVSGRGETFKSGGRVVKNVTGYDLPKLMAGSWGTLAALTEVTLKTLPKAETQASVVLTGLDDELAIAALCAGVGSSADVSAAAHLPAAVARRISGLSPAGAITVLRLEGFEASVRHRLDTLVVLLKSYGKSEAFAAAPSRTLWRAIRDVEPFAASGPAGEHCVWRISTAPTHGAELGRAVAAACDAELFYDWSGGLIWAAIAPGDGEDGGAAAVRKASRACGGHATLVRAPAALRARIDVFDPLDGALATITRRVKEGFDPKGVLNPGRMWAGM